MTLIIKNFIQRDKKRLNTDDTDIILLNLANTDSILLNQINTDSTLFNPDSTLLKPYNSDSILLVTSTIGVGWYSYPPRQPAAGERLSLPATFVHRPLLSSQALWWRSQLTGPPQFCGLSAG